MRRLWHRVLDVGVGPELPDREARYIRVTNGTAVVLALLLLNTAVLAVPYLPSSKYLLVNFTVCPALLMLCLYLNSRKAYVASRLWFGVVGVVCNSIGALQVGIASENHWIMVLIPLAAFYLFPPRQFRYIVLLSVLAFGTVLGLELYLTDRPPIIEAPPETFLVVRLASISFFCALAFGMTLINYRALNAAQDLAEREHEKSEKLLLNILPQSIARRLKEDSSVIADRAESATILFADVVGFTVMSQTMTAEKLVRVLNDLFVEFDHLSANYGLEKIKTIGDAYMVVGGLPAPLANHCAIVAAFALEIQEMLKHRDYPDAAGLQVRIGMHTGPVVAGVIGESKFLYDLWGDSVNTASRMESHGEAGKIQVTREVYEALKSRFAFSTARKIDVKGKGLMEVYFLTGMLYPAPATAAA